MHRQVNESPRSPYHRQDLEKLFGVGSSAAQKLMELMPRLAMANLQVVERPALLEFLAGAIDAPDLRAYLDAIRKTPPKASRRKLRVSIPREFAEGELRSLPLDVQLWRGELGIRFTTLEDLVSKLFQLSTMLELPDFERQFCTSPAPADPTKEEAAQLRDREQLDAEERYVRRVDAVAEAVRRRDDALLIDEHETAAEMDAAATILRSKALLAIDEARALFSQQGIDGTATLNAYDAKLQTLFMKPSTPESHR